MLHVQQKLQQVVQGATLELLAVVYRVLTMRLPFSDHVLHVQN